MKRSALPWIVLGCVILAGVLAWWTVSRSFAPATPPRLEHRELAPFHAIDLGSAARVLLVQDDASAIDIEAPRGTRVDAHVADGRLVVETRAKRSGFGLFHGKSAPSPRITLHFRTLDDIRLHGAVHASAAKLTAPALRIAASGGSKLAIDDLRAESLSVTGSGALDARIAGQVGAQHVEISGAGSYDAERLRSREATVRVSGVGHVVVNVEQALDAEISGAGAIEYVGDPRVTEQVSGIGRVRRKDAATGTGLRAGAQCSGGSCTSLKKSGRPLVASTSGCTPASACTSPTRQSRSSAPSIAATSRALSPG
jgi:hypothetical protein